MAEKLFNFFCLCLACTYKWIGSMPASTSAFTLECPECRATDSFASEISDDYLDAFEEDDEREVITYQ